MSIKPGARLGKRYQLLSPIATGGMGQVWRAEDTTLHRVVAAKILRSEFTGDETFLHRFRVEAQNTASLSHPNIASVYDYGEQVHESERLAYLIMELVEGDPLVDTLARERRMSGERTLDYLEQAATGLAAAHREGMVHRDVKPGNLIIRPDGVLKITDFGIARAANAAALTDQGTVVGTAQYLAPEQAEGKPARPSSDVYALGVVGYECLAGFRPFDGDNSVAIALSHIRDTPRALPPDVPAHIRHLIELTMIKDPDARYRDGDEYVRTVRAVRAGQSPIPAPYRPSHAPIAPVQLPGQARAPGAGGPGGPNAGAPQQGYRPQAPPPNPVGPVPQNSNTPGGAGMGHRNSGLSSPTGPVGPANAPGYSGGPPSARGANPGALASTTSPLTGPSMPNLGNGAANAGTGPTGAANNKRWWWIGGLALAVIVIALVVTLLVTSGDDDANPSGQSGTSAPQSPGDESASSTPTQGPSDEPDDAEAESSPTNGPPDVTMDDTDEVVLDPDKVIGKPLQHVLDGLAQIDYDLQVALMYDGDPADGEPGTVTDAEPFGTPIQPQSVVTLHVVPEESEAPSS